MDQRAVGIYSDGAITVLRRIVCRNGLQTAGWGAPRGVGAKSVVLIL